MGRRHFGVTAAMLAIVLATGAIISAASPALLVAAISVLVLSGGTLLLAYLTRAGVTADVTQDGTAWSADVLDFDSFSLADALDSSRATALVAGGVWLRPLSRNLRFLQQLGMRGGRIRVLVEDLDQDASLADDMRPLVEQIAA